MSDASLRSQIQELQLMAWEWETLPAELGGVWALRLPDPWYQALLTLTDIDETPAVISLYTALRVLAPEIIYFFPNALTTNLRKRPPYWLIMESNVQTIDPERFVEALRLWMLTLYGDDLTRRVNQHLRADLLRWEWLELHTLPLDSLTAVLPHLIARWLVHRPMSFHLTNSAGQAASWVLRHVPAQSKDATLITWEPTQVQMPLSRPISQHYSYTLRLRLGSIPGAERPVLLCQPGIRRWVDVACTLPWKRHKGVYLQRRSASWLTTGAVEASLIRIDLQRLKANLWVGHIGKVMQAFSFTEQLPMPDDLLADPARYQPGILVTYDTMLGQNHLAGAGIEEADRWEVFTQLTEALPATFTPVARITRWSIPKRLANSSATAEVHKNVEPAERRAAIKSLGSATTIEIVSSDAAYWQQVVAEELGLAPGETDPHITIRPLTLAPEAYGELAAEAVENVLRQQVLEHERVHQIAQLLGRAEGKTGVLVELPNFRELYPNSRRVQRDPKRANRWGFARSGRVSQFIEPQSRQPDNYKERVHNGVRDLLRQLGYHFAPLYRGYSKSHLPVQLDLIGLRLMRLNARLRGGQQGMLPLVVHAPADGSGERVCLPSPEGPRWRTYYEALLTLPDITEEYNVIERVRSFFKEVLLEMALTRPTLLLLDEYQLRRVWPTLTVIPGKASSNLGDILPTNDLVRAMCLRYSTHGEVPLVCPPVGFGRFSGVFRNPQYPEVFYSMQERPVTAKRVTGLRQRDADQKHAWNPSTVEMRLIQRMPSDVIEEWVGVVHRLREESAHVNVATLLPEPLHLASKMDEYVTRLTEETES